MTKNSFVAEVAFKFLLMLLLGLDLVIYVICRLILPCRFPRENQEEFNTF